MCSFYQTFLFGEIGLENIKPHKTNRSLNIQNGHHFQKVKVILQIDKLHQDFEPKNLWAKILIKLIQAFGDYHGHTYTNILFGIPKLEGFARPSKNLK